MDKTGTWTIAPSQVLQLGTAMLPGGIAVVRIAGQLCLINRNGSILFGSYKGSSLAAVVSALDAEKDVIAGLKSINHAQISYASSYPDVGFADTLTKLGPPLSGSPTSAHAGLIAADLASGSYKGYQFVLAAPTESSFRSTRSWLRPREVLLANRSARIRTVLSMPLMLVASVHRTHRLPSNKRHRKESPN